MTSPGLGTAGAATVAAAAGFVVTAGAVTTASSTSRRISSSAASATGTGATGVSRVFAEEVVFSRRTLDVDTATVTGAAAGSVSTPTDVVVLLGVLSAAGRAP